MAIPASIEPFPGQSSSALTVLESRRLTELLTQAETQCARGRLPDLLRERISKDNMRG
jgi:hypothetical protein